MRSFLGLVGYYRIFIQDFSKIAASLTQLTRKGKTFLWDSACEQSFKELKHRLVIVSVLAVPYNSGNFVVLDALEKGQVVS